MFPLQEWYYSHLALSLAQTRRSSRLSLGRNAQNVVDGQTPALALMAQNRCSFVGL